jgi:hypothetical protein
MKKSMLDQVLAAKNPKWKAGDKVRFKKDTSGYYAPYAGKEFTIEQFIPQKEVGDDREDAAAVKLKELKKDEPNHLIKVWSLEKVQGAATKKVEFYNIEWDAESELEHADLPDSVTLDVPADLNVEYDGADILSDKFGYTVFGFNFKEKGTTMKSSLLKRILASGKAEAHCYSTWHEGLRKLEEAQVIFNKAMGMAATENLPTEMKANLSQFVADSYSMQSNAAELFEELREVDAGAPAAPKEPEEKEETGD